MGKKILDSKLLYVVLSVLLSFCAWLYITSLDATKDSQPFRGLPVQLTDVDILEERGLMVVDENVTATLNIRATPLVLATLNKTPPTLKASVSNIGLEGKHTVVYTIELPDGVRQSDVEYVNTNNTVTVQVARFLRREILIEGRFEGKAAEGYLAGNEGDFKFSPGSIWISGQAELVNQVHHAEVTIVEENLTDTVSDNFPFKLIGASGNVLEDLDVTCDVDMVYTVFPIRATAEIPLVVTLTSGGGLGEDDVRIDLSTDSIMVAGDKDAVAALVNEGSITLGNIDLAAVRDGDELTFSVPLEDDLENLSGMTEVKATVKIKKRVVSQNFSATHIQTINEPEGWNVDIVTQALSVEIRGTQKLMDELLEENIRVVADLQNINLVPGQQTVPVKIALDSAGTKSEIGEMASPGSGYTIVITLTQAPAGAD